MRIFKRRQVRDNLEKATQVQVTQVPRITRATWPWLHEAGREAREENAAAILRRGCDQHPVFGPHAQ